MPKIIPTVGRVVWYYPGKDDDLQRFNTVSAGKPLAAHVACVWSDTCVNLMVIDPNGNQTSRTSVYLYPGDGERPSSCFAEWMPYQQGQAAKTEALEAKLIAPKAAGLTVTDEMVSRFLSWRLPADFSPDCGISFKGESDYDHPQFGRTKHEPTGTNLLHAGQARAMLEHVLGVVEPVQTPA